MTNEPFGMTTAEIEDDARDLGMSAEDYREDLRQQEAEEKAEAAAAGMTVEEWRKAIDEADAKYCRERDAARAAAEEELAKEERKLQLLKAAFETDGKRGTPSLYPV